MQMADYSNAHPSTHSGLELDNDYSNREGHDDHSDKGSISGGSDHSSGGHRNGSDGHHDDDHKGHDRDGDLSDREDDGSDKEDHRSDKEDRQSDRGSRRSDRSDRKSDRGDRRSDRGDGDSHSAHDKEGSLHGSNDGSADHRDDLSGDVYDALDEINDLVEHAEAEQNFYSSADDQDRKSDDSHSDGEGEGHAPQVRPRSSVEVARADDGGVYDGIYEELPDHRSDSDHSEKGGRARDDHGGPSDDLYDDVGVGHSRANGHQRRGSRDSDEENQRSSVDGRVKRQTSSNAPTSSGKFMLRTSRKADALHVLRHIRDSSSADDNPELDELVTVLRSTDHNSKHDDSLKDEEKQKEKLKSFITSKLIHKFEQGIASDEAFDANHDNFQAADTSRINDRHNTTVVKTTVVKTVKVDANHPVSPKGSGIPLSPTAAVASGSSVASDVSRSSSSSSLSSASQIHQKSVTHDSHGSNHGATKSITVTTVQVTVNPSRHPGNESPKTPDESTTIPAWKAEIEMRKKTKSHIPTQKPREPMKMSEVPEWKKQLQEKNKMKKLSSSDETDITLDRVTTVEMDRLKHEVVITHHGSHGGHGAHGGHRGDNHLPEWARLADEKHKTISH